MAAHTGTVGPPIRAVTMEPEVLRQIIASLAPVPGVVGPSDFATTQNGTPNMSVNLGSGFALVKGTDNAPVQGFYPIYNDAAVNLAIAASNPTNPRIDVVCATIQDGYYAGGVNTWVMQVITGTPGATPAVPALPNSSLAFAQVYVAAGVSSILNANITDVRAWASGVGDTGNNWCRFQNVVGNFPTTDSTFSWTSGVNPDGNMNASSGYYTAPRTGYYLMNGGITLGSAGVDTTAHFATVGYSVAGGASVPMSTQYLPPFGSMSYTAMVYAQAGQTLALTLKTNSATTIQAQQAPWHSIAFFHS